MSVTLRTPAPFPGHAVPGTHGSLNFWLAPPCEIPDGLPAEIELRHAPWRVGAASRTNSEPRITCQAEWMPVSGMGGAHEGYCALFQVPIPGVQLAGFELRLFRMKAGVLLKAGARPALAVHSPIVNVEIESLSKEANMDGKPLLHCDNVPLRKKTKETKLCLR